MTDDVQHMKWWGWGLEHLGYRYDDKPKLASFVLDKIGVDITKPAGKPPVFEDMEIPASRLDDGLRGTLEQAIGADYVRADDMERVIHGYGKGVRDLVRVRRGDFGRLPDVVVYPGNENDVVKIVDAVVAVDGVLIPFGGGSNIVAALEATPDEQRQVVSIDMGRMNKVLEIDEEAGLARIQAGVLGPDMEAQLEPRGWTMGHFPDSFTHSTLGGWIATRSTGMQSDKYGDIADITRGLRMVMPGQVLELHPLPSASSGPSVREMVLGSEGRLGIITEAWVNVHRVPEVREIIAYFFPTYRDGVEAMHDILVSDAEPSVTRVSDENETAFTFATQKASKGVSKVVTNLFQKNLERKGWDLSRFCISFIGYEGTPSHVAYTKNIVEKIIREHGGAKVGKGPGALYDQKKFDTPYIRDFLLDFGALADVSETASPWSMMVELHDEAVRRVQQVIADENAQGFIMCHLSHSYHSGACQYFTFAVNDTPERAERTYDKVKQAIQTCFVEHRSSVSHHHGVGEEHAPWLAEDISPAGVFIQEKLFEGVDPGKNLNPGKIIHEGKPRISTNSPDQG